MDLERRAFALWHLYVYPKLAIAYTYIPKNACSSFKRTLGVAQGWLDEDARSSHDMKVSHRMTGLIRYPGTQERIVVIRDPWDRLLSAYQHRFLQRQDDASRHALKTGLGEMLGPDGSQGDVTFDQFLTYLSRTPDRVLNSHWRPQRDFLVGSYTRMLRFEHLADDASFLADRGMPLQSVRGHGTSSMRRDLGPGWGSRPARQLRHLRRRKGVLPSKSSMYDERLTELVRERYAGDVELWLQISRAAEGGVQKG